MTDVIKVIGGSLVERLLTWPEAIELMRATHVAVSEGAAELPLRQVVSVPGTANRMGVMPGYIAAPGGLGVKVVTLFPGAASHPGFILLFDPESGTPMALISAAEVTAIRTAAASAAATQILAAPQASDLAILGSGAQAFVHLQAMAQVRAFKRIRVWARSPANASAFAAACGAGLGVGIEPMLDPRSAVEGADVICTTTSSPTPILQGSWVGLGAHVNLVGSSIPTTSEADADLVRRASYFVDYRASALAQAGELRLAVEAGLVDLTHVRAEIGEVIAGRAPGRTSADEITVFKSLGNAAQDLAAARYVYDRAAAEGLGEDVRL